MGLLGTIDNNKIEGLWVGMDRFKLYKKECEKLYQDGDYSVNVVLFLFRKYGTDGFISGGKYYGWIPYYNNKKPVKNKKINFTSEIINNIIKDYTDGLSLVKLSEKYGFSIEKIRKTLPNNIVRPNKKINKETVLLIHKMFNEENKQPKEIASMFNLSDSIYNILNGRRWSDVYKLYHTS